MGRQKCTAHCSICTSLPPVLLTKSLSCEFKDELGFKIYCRTQRGSKACTCKLAEVLTLKKGQYLS